MHISGKTSWNLASKATSELINLREILLAKEEVRSTGSLPVVETSLTWLRNCRHESGYWGLENVAVTSLCCLAMARSKPGAFDEWLEPTVDWLATQETGGRWDTYWDTALAIQAFTAVAKDGHPVAFKAKRALHNLQIDDDLVTSHGAHHAAQVLRALADTRAPAHLRDRWAEHVLERMENDDKDDIYVCSQVVHACVTAGGIPPERLRPLSDVLEKHLRAQQRPSEGGLRDYAPAIQALSCLPEHRPLVQDKVGLIIDAHTEKRAWYGEPRHTAWALLALLEASQERVLVIDKPTFNTAMARAIREVPAGQRRQRARAAIFATALLLEFELIATLVWRWNHTNSLLINGIATGALGITLPLVIHQLITAIRGESDEGPSEHPD